MKTYATVSDARQAARENGCIQAIIEIDHAQDGRCYIGARCNADTLRQALASKPIPEIKTIVAEHPRTATVIAGRAAEGLKRIRALRAEADRYEDSDPGHSIQAKNKAMDAQKTWEEKYPREAAYRRAEAVAGMSNCEYSAAGRTAMHKIEDGEDHTQAIAEMDAEMNAETARHMLD